MAELSRDEAVASVGPVGDVAIAEIIATGITKDELIAAHDRVVKDMKEDHPGPSLVKIARPADKRPALKRGGEQLLEMSAAEAKSGATYPTRIPDCAAPHPGYSHWIAGNMFRQVVFAPITTAT